MFDDFRVDESGKTAVTEREVVAASSDQQAMAPAQPSQFILKNIEPHCGWQVHDSSAGATPNVQEVLTLLEVFQDDPMASPLPVALQPDWTVEGSVVVVRRGDRVAQFPHVPQGP